MRLAKFEGESLRLIRPPFMQLLAPKSSKHRGAADTLAEEIRNYFLAKGAIDLWANLRKYAPVELQELRDELETHKHSSAEADAICEKGETTSAALQEMKAAEARLQQSRTVTENE